jgi:hypothetical protein
MLVTLPRKLMNTKTNTEENRGLKFDLKFDSLPYAL